MAGFRGFGDDAMKVAADQRQHAAQMEQIAAQERASRRSAAVAMAGQAENARQADMQLQAHKEELQAGRTAAAEENAAQRSFAAGQADLNRAAAAEESGAQRAFQAEQAGLNRAEASAARTQDDILKERQLAINEATFANLNQQWEQEKAMQAERADRENASTLAAMRVAATAPDGMVPPMFLNAINESRGVVAGDPGSITGLFSIRDPKSGDRYGFGVMEVDKDGNQIQKSLDPAQVLPKMFSQMKPADSEKLARDIVAGGSTSFDDKMALMAKKHIYDMEKEAEISKRANTRGLVNPKVVETFQDQELQLKALIAKDQKEGKPVDPRTQDLLRITQDKIKAATSAGLENEAEPAASVSAAPAGGNGASISGENVTITLDGQTKTVKDSPALRKWLSAKGISIQ